MPKWSRTKNFTKDIYSCTSVGSCWFILSLFSFQCLASTCHIHDSITGLLITIKTIFVLDAFKKSENLQESLKNKVWSRLFKVVTLNYEASRFQENQWSSGYIPNCFKLSPMVRPVFFISVTLHAPLCLWMEHQTMILHFWSRKRYDAVVDVSPCVETLLFCRGWGFSHHFWLRFARNKCNHCLILRVGSQIWGMILFEMVVFPSELLPVICSCNRGSTKISL